MVRYRRSGRLNLRLLALLTGVIVVGVGGIVVARQIQVRNLAARARADGLAAYTRADWTTATRELRRSLRRISDDPEVLEKYADANLKLKPTQRADCLAAAEALYRLIKLRPEDAALFERLARLRFGLRDFAELERMAARRLESAPDDTTARIWLARGQLGRRGLDAARSTLTALEGSLKAIPAEAERYCEVCMLLSATAELAVAPGVEVERWLDTALAVRPDYAAALLHRARIRVGQAARAKLAERERLERGAREDLERFDAAAPADVELRLTAAASWAALDDAPRGAAELAVVDALAPDLIAQAFPITADWIAMRFHADAAVALQQTPAPTELSWLDHALNALEARAERAPILADAVRVLCRAGRAQEARELLTELEQSRALASHGDGDDEVAFLGAVVARAAGDDFAAINALEPLALRSTAPPGVWVLLAEAYSRSGQPRRAAAALTQYLRQAPDDAAAQMSLVQEYVRLRDWGRAVEMARAAQARRPQDMELALLRVESTLQVAAQRSGAERHEELERVRVELARLATVEPKRVEIRILQANLALLTDDEPAAEQALRSALVECSDPLPAELELVQVLHRAERRQEALAAARECASRYASRGVPQQLLAELLVAQGDTPGAIEALRRALDGIQGGSERRAADIKLALLEIQGPARSAGIERLRGLVAGEPRDLRSVGMLLSLPEIRADAAAAQALVDGLRRVEGEAGLTWRIEQATLWLEDKNWRGHAENAVTLLNRCIQADPAWDRPVLLLGALHEREDRLDLAEAAYRRLLNMNSGAAEVADRLLALLDQSRRHADQQELLRTLALPRASLSGWRLAIALHARDFEQAADVLRLRISNDAGDAAARVLMARLVFHQAGDADQALAHLDEAEAISGDLAPILTTRLLVLEAAGRADDALRLLDERVRTRGDFESRWMRGAFLMRLGRTDEAEIDYAALPQAANDARGYEMLGAFREQQGRVDDAVAVWRSGLEKYPDSADLARRLAGALLKRGRGDDRARAGAIAAKLEQERPNDADALLLRASCLIMSADPVGAEQATALLERAVRLNPRGVDGHLLLIRLAMEEEAFGRARELTIRALGAAGDDPRLFVARARAELAGGNPGMARELARSVWQQQPRNTAAVDVLVDTAIVQRDDALLRDTIEELRGAAPTQDVRARYALALGRLLVAAGRPDEAVQTLQAVVPESEPRPDVAVLLALAELHAGRGGYESAGQCIERAAATEPDSPAVLQARVLWLGAQQRHAELDAIVRAATPMARDWPQVLVAAGVGLAASSELNHRQRATELLEQALARLPTRSPVRLDVAAQLFAMGELDRAEALFRAAIERDPDDARALNDLAWLLAEGRRQFDEALRLADRGVQLAPTSIELRDTRAHILMRSGQRLDDARMDYQQCVELSRPESAGRAQALLKLAHVCVAQNDGAAAERHLGAAEAIDSKVSAFSPQERAEAQRLRSQFGPSHQ